jgi:hypothetical protein
MVHVARRPRTFAAVLLVVVVAVLGATSPAHAGLPVLARGNISITYDSNAQYVCPSGHVDDGVTLAGVWLFEIDGAVAHDTRTVVGPAYNLPCYTVWKSLPAGGYVATLSFAAAGTSDFTVVACGVGFWAAGQDTVNSCGF